MKPYIAVYLTQEQRAQRNALIRSGNAAARIQTRARILLLVDRHPEPLMEDATVAAALRCHKNTVGNVRRRFARQAPLRSARTARGSV
jgi:hypothetical protein